MFLTFCDALLTLAYPHVCAICFRSVEQRRFGVACELCWRATKIFTVEETICWKCGKFSEVVNSPAVREQVRCGSCDSHAFTAARAIGLYKGALRESVLHLKRQPHLAKHVESLLGVAAKRAPLDVVTRIVPVPLHEKRLRTRGFNQASIIGHALSRLLKLPVDEVCLVRVSATEKYRAGLDAKGRQDTVAGAFAVRYPRLVAGENILLVDDVFTTGATVSACAEVLIAAGARSVCVLTLARA